MISFNNLIPRISDVASDSPELPGCSMLPWPIHLNSTQQVTVWDICSTTPHRSSVSLWANSKKMFKWSLVRKLPSCGRMSRDSFVIMLNHHHVSSCQPHHHVGSMWVHRWKHSRARNPMFFQVKWLSRVSVSAGAGLDLRKLSKKVHRTVARARFALQNVEKLSGSEHFWKMRSMRSTKCAPDCCKSSICASNCEKYITFRAAPDLCGRVLLLTLRGCFSTWCDAPAIQVCNWLWQNALARLRAGKYEWRCDAPGKRDCSRTLLNALSITPSRKKHLGLERTSNLSIDFLWG